VDALKTIIQPILNQFDIRNGYEVNSNIATNTVKYFRFSLKIKRPVILPASQQYFI